MCLYVCMYIFHSFNVKIRGIFPATDSLFFWILGTKLRLSHLEASAVYCHSGPLFTFIDFLIFVKVYEWKCELKTSTGTDRFESNFLTLNIIIEGLCIIELEKSGISS